MEDDSIRPPDETVPILKGMGVCTLTSTYRLNFETVRFLDDDAYMEESTQFRPLLDNSRRHGYEKKTTEIRTTQRKKNTTQSYPEVR